MAAAPRANGLGRGPCPLTPGPEPPPRSTAGSNPVLAALRPVFQGQRLVVVTRVARAANRMARQLQRLGAPPPIVVAPTPGGDPPGPDLAPFHIQPRPLVDGLPRHPSPATLAFLNHHDPHRLARQLWICNSQPTRWADRDAWRPPEPRRIGLEDKCAVDALLDRAGVPRAASKVVPLTEARPCWKALDMGHGVAWSGNGRQAPPTARAAIVQAVRRLGATLRHHHQYRGAFTLDGLATAGGFVPTELNARLGEGGAVLEGIDEALPLNLLDLALRARHPLALSAEALEDTCTALWGPHPDTRPRTVCPSPWPEDTCTPLGRVGGIPTLGAEPVEASFWRHPMGSQSFARIVPRPGMFTDGAPMAPLVAEWFAALGPHLGLDFHGWRAQVDG